MRKIPRYSAHLIQIGELLVQISDTTVYLAGGPSMVPCTMLDHLSRALLTRDLRVSSAGQRDRGRHGRGTNERGGHPS